MFCGIEPHGVKIMAVGGGCGAGCARVLNQRVSNSREARQPYPSHGVSEGLSGGGCAGVKPREAGKAQCRGAGEVKRRGVGEVKRCGTTTVPPVPERR